MAGDTSSFYMEKVTAARAQLLSEEEQLHGEGMLSVETQEDFNEDSFYNYSRDHFAGWIKMLRCLPRDKQELVLSYYLVKKPQIQLAKIHSCTQTVASYQIRMAIKIAGTFLMLGGVPTVEWMRPLLIKAGLENTLKVPLSQLISEYAECRNFVPLANKYDLHRPDIRKAMSRASKHFLDRNDDENWDENPAPQDRSPEELALGSYIFGLLDKASFEGRGRSKRAKDRECRLVYKTDPDILGEFRVDVNHPDFGHFFVSQAML